MREQVDSTKLETSQWMPGLEQGDVVQYRIFGSPGSECLVSNPACHRPRLAVMDCSFGGKADRLARKFPARRAANGVLLQDALLLAGAWLARIASP